MNYNEIGGPNDSLTNCALCDKQIWLADSWSPADEAICAECDTEVTGREHAPSIHVPIYHVHFGEQQLLVEEGLDGGVVLHRKSIKHLQLFPELQRLLHSMAELLDDSPKYSCEWELKEEAFALIKEVLG